MSPANPSSETPGPDPWAAHAIEIDHLVVAAGSLGAGSAWLEERLGVALQPGGRHLGWGTHNRLLNLGGGCYLELIAPDPSQPPPSGPRPFGIDRPELRAAICRAPRLVHFVARTRDLDAALRAIAYDPGPPSAMSRGDLRWRITLPADGNPAGGGLLPTLIEWDAGVGSRHPASALADRGVTLEELRIRAPAPIVAALRGIDHDPRVRLDADESPASAGLSAALSTPNGPVELL